MSTEAPGISFGIYRPNKENPLTNEQIESWSVFTSTVVARLAA